MHVLSKLKKSRLRVSNLIKISEEEIFAGLKKLLNFAVSNLIKILNMDKNSICPRCENNTFEAVPADILYVARPMHFIRCADCGCVITAIDDDTGDLIRDIAEKLGINR